MRTNHDYYWRRGYEDVVIKSMIELVGMAVSGDCGRVRYSLCYARHQGTLAALFSKLLQVNSPSELARQTFRTAWSAEQGLHIWEDVKDDLLMLDVFRHLFPPYSGPALELYRGERGYNHETREYEAAWTTKPSVAEMYARGLNCCERTGGFVPYTIASPDAIITGPGDHMRWEAEHVVDRRNLLAVSVLKHYPPKIASKTLRTEQAVINRLFGQNRSLSRVDSQRQSSRQEFRGAPRLD